MNQISNQKGNKDMNKKLLFSTTFKSSWTPLIIQLFLLWQEKKTFTFRSCEWCKKRYVLNAYACTKCDYILCPRNECRSKSERSVCVPANHRPSANSLVQPTLKADCHYEQGQRPDSPSRAETPINISQQILPVNQLKVSIITWKYDRAFLIMIIFDNLIMIILS